MNDTITTGTPDTIATGVQVATEDLDTTVTRLRVAEDTWHGGAQVIASNSRVHIKALRRELEATNDDRIAVIEQRNKANDALREFKDRVRDAAIEAQAGHAGHVSRDSLNEWLRELGLDPVTTKWNCEGTWRGMDLPSAVVEADDEESALDKYRSALQDAEVSLTLSINGEVSDTDEVVFGSNYISEENDYFDDVEFDIDEADLTAEQSDE